MDWHSRSFSREKGKHRQKPNHGQPSNPRHTQEETI